MNRSINISFVALGSGAINVVAFIIALIVGGWVANKVL